MDANSKVEGTTISSQVGVTGCSVYDMSVFLPLNAVPLCLHDQTHMYKISLHIIFRLRHRPRAGRHDQLG
ncbi:hypothetical protein VTJ04DRAFT_7413 [Mycothermus thermophilus]|uniref:uncharacterized protein n=1 Tax=Humicola insolens TaxID=85995 RepID=UPI0037433926